MAEPKPPSAAGSKRSRKGAAGAAVIAPPSVSLREFVTPEGIDLKLRIGDAGERVAALLIDLLIILALVVGLTIAACSALVAGGRGPGEAVAIVWLLGFFIVRNFYFTAFELSGRAATPGKRAMGLRVISRDGGRLTAEAVFSRNAMRELELFLPLIALVVPGEGVDAWLKLFAMVWTGVFLFFPLFNRDRLRVGDLVAGTMVVRAPKKVLRPDLAEDGLARSSGIRFTDAQLDAYGIKELHVLEDVLRRSDRRTTKAVAERIRQKIGWPPEAPESDAAFLAAYYAGLRNRLETRMLFGKRRKDKFDVS